MIIIHLSQQVAKIAVRDIYRDKTMLIHWQNAEKK